MVVDIMMIMLMMMRYLTACYRCNIRKGQSIVLRSPTCGALLYTLPQQLTYQKILNICILMLNPNVSFGTERNRANNPIAKVQNEQ